MIIRSRLSLSIEGQTGSVSKTETIGETKDAK